MGLFDKNPNEVFYHGGKKHWADVIKNTGSGELLIWRQPEEDFNTNSTLIVMPGEEAIFVKGGNIEATFDNGTYKLTTENYPFISRLRNAFTGGISTFNCVVYFVRKAVSQEIRWGTETPIQVRDKYWRIRTDVRARGAFKVRIENPVKFLEKLLGNNIGYLLQGELNKYFSSEFQGKIKSAVSKFLNGLEQELIGIDAYIDELSEQITPRIDEIVQEYGLKCVSFSFAGLDVDNSKYDKIDQSQMTSISNLQLTEGEARSKVLLAQGDKQAMDTLGKDWDRLQSAQIIGDLVNNPGAGGLGALGAGLGMGVAAGNVFGNISGQIFSGMNQQSVSQEAETNHTESSLEDPIEVLMRLKKMLDLGLIEQNEYDTKKSEILNRM